MRRKRQIIMPPLAPIREERYELKNEIIKIIWLTIMLTIFIGVTTLILWKW